ncbi:MAG: AAA-like domain-containing protein [Fimbriimonadaceae bacterium]|nr:AAA-like domain-containing protein [Fimbriimonadaceae bacterium]
MPSSSFLYVTGGTLAPDAPSYVERGADRDLLAHLESGETCYVLNSRQMGKSSLCVRTIGKLKEQGIRTAFCDLTKFGGRNVTPEQWYAALTAEIGRDLGLRAEFIAYFKENSALPPVQRLFGAIVEVGLVPDSPLVVFIDEIDATRSLSFSTDEFFAAIRECHNRRVQDPRYLRLSFCMLGVAVPSDLINIATSTPFNIGKRIALEDFSLDEAMALSAGLCSPTRSEAAAQAVLKRVHEWTNGQPYLTQSLCSAVAGDETILTAADVDRLVHRDLLDPMARQTNINLADVANRAVHAGDLEPDPEKFRADLLSAYERIWRGKHYADDEANRTAALLKLSGIVAAEGNKLRVRNLIYRRVFDRAWVRENMPGQELRRQRRSFWKGVLRTSLVSAAVVCVVGYFAFAAQQAQRETEAAKKELDYQLYVARMNNMQLFDQEGNGLLMSKVLEETKDSPHRGWEWGYWNRKLDDSDEEYVLDTENRDPTPSATFSPDGRQILILDRRQRKAFLVDRKLKQIVADYPVEKDELLMPYNSGWITYADRNGFLEVRDLTTAKVRFRLRTGNSVQAYIADMKRSGVGVLQQLTSGVSSSTSVIDFYRGKKLWSGKVSFPDFSGADGLSTSQDGSRIVVMAGVLKGEIFKGEFAVVDRKNRTLDRWSADNSSNYLVQISPSGQYWVIPELDKTLVREVTRGRTLLSFDHGRYGKVAGVYFSCDGKVLSLLTDKGRVVFLSIPEGKQLAVYQNTTALDINPISNEVIMVGSTVRVVGFSPSKQKTSPIAYRVAPSYDEGILRDFTISVEFLSDPGLLPVRKIMGDAMGVASSGNGRIVAKFERSPSGRESVLRETATGQPLQRSRVGWFSVDTSDSGNLYVTISRDQRLVEAYRFGQPKPVWSRSAYPDDPIYRTQVSRDGQGMLVTSRLRLLVIDPNTGKVTKTFEGANFYNAGYLGKGSRYYVLTDGPVQVFDGHTHALLYELPRELGWSMTESPDGKRVLTTDGWNTTIYDSTTQQRLCRIPDFTAGCFTRDGKTLLGTRNGQFEAVRTSDSNPVTRLKGVFSTDKPKAPK